ncbi:MAG: hypothetical protein NT001_04020 [Candidatus Woesearchaeota archaeon]|nr:hypothetical protein [Candidatus Woesearchaeota archaeon]
MKVFKLDKASTAKRKDLEGIIFIETDDHGTLFTDNLDRELWEFDYDIIKQGPNKSDKYKFENYPDKMIESLDARSRSLIDKINEFIDKYSLRFSKIHTFNGKTWNKVDLERIPPVNSGNRMFAEKEKLLEYYHTYTVFGGIDEISDKDAAEKLKPDDHAHYRILQKDSHGNISPISDKEIGLAIHRLDGFKLTDLGPASDAMLKGIAGLMQDIYIGKYDKNSANHTADVHQTQSGTPSDDIITLQQDADGVWGNGIKSESIFSRYDPVSYIKKYVSKYISEYIPSWKKIKRYSAVGALTLGLLLGSLHIGNKTCTNYGFAQPVQRTEILHDAHNTKQKDISDISSVPRNYNILQSPVNIQSMQESVQYNDKDTDKDENNLSERLDDFRTKKIGPTSSMISNLKDVSVENGNIDFTIGSRGNADEVYAFFGTDFFGRINCKRKISLKHSCRRYHLLPAIFR